MDQTLEYPSARQSYSVDRLEKSFERSDDATSNFKRFCGTLVFSTYKYIIGPALHSLGGAGFGCRYHPTCSVYAREAFQKHSFFCALKLSFLRLLRCNPWVNRDYVDPVPTQTGKKES